MLAGLRAEVVGFRASWEGAELLKAQAAKLQANPICLLVLRDWGGGLWHGEPPVVDGLWFAWSPKNMPLLRERHAC